MWPHRHLAKSGLPTVLEDTQAYLLEHPQNHVDGSCFLLKTGEEEGKGKKRKKGKKKKKKVVLAPAQHSRLQRVFGPCDDCAGAGGQSLL